MQFQVPQNITMEDKIIGNLSPIQFAILVLGGLSSFVIFSTGNIPDPLNKGLGLFLGMLTVLFALGKFNDQPLYRFFKFIVRYVTTPKIRVWHKKGGTEIVLIKPNPVTKSTQATRTVKKVSHGDIAQLATLLDSHGTVGKAPAIDIHTEPKPEPKAKPAK